MFLWSELELYWIVERAFSISDRVRVELFVFSIAGMTLFLVVAVG